MAKSQAIGHVDCHVCGLEAEIKQDKNGKAYIYCPDCNIQSFTRTEYQSNKLLARMRPVTVTENAPPVAAQKVEITPSVAVKQPPKTGGFDMGLA